MRMRDGAWRRLAGWTLPYQTKPLPTPTTHPCFLLATMQSVQTRASTRSATASKTAPMAGTLACWCQLRLPMHAWGAALRMRQRLRTASTAKIELLSAPPFAALLFGAWQPPGH